MCSLAGVWTLAIVCFAWSATRPVEQPGDVLESAAPDGETLFVRHCATCHEAGEVGSSYRQAADREETMEELREFLADHYGPSPEAIGRIVSHLMGT